MISSSDGSNPVFFLDELQELAASLGGKVLPYRFLTLSFQEFLRFKTVSFPDRLSSSQAARRNNLLMEYPGEAFQRWYWLSGKTWTYPNTAELLYG